VFTRNLAFNTAVAEWNLPGLQSALAADPALANAEDATGCTALHLVARQRPAAIGKAPEDAIPLAEALLEAGADIDHVALPQTPSDTFCPTPLWQAIAWSRNGALAHFVLERCVAQAYAGGKFENTTAAILVIGSNTDRIWSKYLWR
jgi:hypothetical protein